MSKSMPAVRKAGLPLRIGTFNGQFLPYMVSCGARAQMLADGIMAGDYDIIGLNEVFSGRARRVLVERLAPDYPYIVECISSHNRLRLDSGLMLFSKLPLDDLTDLGEFSSVRIRTRSANHTLGSGCVRFDEFADHLGSDGLATKGAAYVRVTLDGRPLHVFLTHVQASYLNHSVKRYLRTVSVRESQIRQMAGFMHDVLGTRAGCENVAILGDFNVHFSATGAGYPHRGATLHGDEWEMMFGAFDQVFGGNLVDVWRRYAPPQDQGLTFPSDKPRTRPDYILLSVADPIQPLCVQQVSLAQSLTVSGGRNPRELSDHMGVSVDLNLPMPRCNVAQAQRVCVDGRQVLLDGRIEHSGGLQWYGLDGSGVYRIGFSSDSGARNLRIEVYADSDISRPLEPKAAAAAYGDGVVEYELGAMSYLRVGDPRRSASGNYTLQVTRIGV